MPFPGEDKTYHVPCEHALNPPQPFEDTCHYCMQQEVRVADKERRRLEQLPPKAMNKEIRRMNAEAYTGDLEELFRAEDWKRILIEKRCMDECLKSVRQLANASGATKTEKADRIQTLKTGCGMVSTPMTATSPVSATAFLQKTRSVFRLEVP
jgi:hypothetical protein